MIVKVCGRDIEAREIAAFTELRAQEEDVLMEITVSYFGQLRHIAGVETEDRLGGDGVPLIDALKELAELYEEQFARILFDEDGALRPSVMVLVNDAPVNREALPNLNAGDRVALLPAIAGG